MKEDGKLPFLESQASSNQFIRTFSAKTPSEEFTWHRDAEDREIFIISNSGNKKWLLQLDNSLPTSLEEGKTFFIQNGMWHRVIPGSEDLKILVIKRGVS